MTLQELYDAMCRYLIANDWRRGEEGSGWWWKDTATEGEATIGGAVEQQFDLDGFDTRDMRPWEPYEFWDAPVSSSADPAEDEVGDD